jgi:prephenate dehydratase
MERTAVTDQQPSTAAPRRHLVVTLQLPDRPGALGAVASRIGALGADITDVHVSSRHGGIAEDVFHLDLPGSGDVDTVGLLLAEIRQVDGVVAPSLSYPPSGCCGSGAPA